MMTKSRRSRYVSLSPGDINQRLQKPPAVARPWPGTREPRCYGGMALARNVMSPRRSPRDGLLSQGAEAGRNPGDRSIP